MPPIRAALAGLAACVALSAGAASAQELRRAQPWDPEIVDLFETIPVQEDGRVKPFKTFADFKLLQVNGKRTLSFTMGRDGRAVRPGWDEDGLEKVKLGGTEFMLDCLFFPEQARAYPCFLISTLEIADAIHLPYSREGRHGKKMRDRFSYDEIAPARDELDLYVRRYFFPDGSPKSDPKRWTYVEQGVIQLHKKLRLFDSWIHLLDFARQDYAVPAEGNLAMLLDGAERLGHAALLEKLPLLGAALQAIDEPGPMPDDARRETEKRALMQLLAPADRASRMGVGLALFPPSVPAADEARWYTVDDLFQLRFGEDPARAEAHLPAVGALEQAMRVRGDSAALKAPVQRLHDEIVGLAQARGEYGRIESEVAYYRADLLFWAQVLYVLAFVGIAASWMASAGARVHRVLPWALLVPLALHATAIAWRCWIRSRPPITNLYETIPFIAGVGVLAAIVIEFINRRRIALPIAALIGAGGLFLASRFEAKEAYTAGSDTMSQLGAVLDTNFWLATHVTTINIGYAATMLAGLLGHVYVFGKLFGAKKGDPDFYRSIARMTYGAVCFALLFSVVGTILGGVWANDSWGRFWGWDPKENGALMICIGLLAILHARMGGWLRDLGVCVAAGLCTNLVLFSWWHVNELSIGLHTYGQTEGTMFWLSLGYGAESLIGLGGIYLGLDERLRRRALRQA